MNTEVLFSRLAVDTFTTPKVRFCRYALSDPKVAGIRTQLHDIPGKFVP
jgi:hypothetical protein